jgi:exo-beta-1,3-glucanase (GH17 family)
MKTYRHWITFSPPRPFNPNTSTYPTQPQIQTALQQLYNEGWRGLVTYSLDGTLDNVPRIAKQIGFFYVIAGLFWFDDAQLVREHAAALQQVPWIDAYVVGNEGLQFQRYSRPALEQEINTLRTATNRPVATTEPLNQYIADPSLLNVGDWVFPTIHPWYANISSIPDATQYVQTNCQALQSKTTKDVLVKEAWWPTGGGDSNATESNQTEFFQQLAATDVKFIWGEAFDQYWKNEALANDPGPHWGLHSDYGVPKQIIDALRTIYTAPY